MKGEPREVGRFFHWYKRSKTDHVDSQIDMLPLLANTAIEMICQAGFGHCFESLSEDKPPHPYATAVKDFA